jgi:hypothetical protein
VDINADAGLIQARLILDRIHREEREGARMPATRQSAENALAAW